MWLGVVGLEAKGQISDEVDKCQDVVVGKREVEGGFR